jgi:hypothetical protein
VTWQGIVHFTLSALIALQASPKLPDHSIKGTTPPVFKSPGSLNFAQEKIASSQALGSGLNYDLSSATGRTLQLKTLHVLLLKKLIEYRVFGTCCWGHGMLLVTKKHGWHMNEGV